MIKIFNGNLMLNSRLDKILFFLCFIGGIEVIPKGSLLLKFLVFLIAILLVIIRIKNPISRNAITLIIPYLMYLVYALFSVSFISASPSYIAFAILPLAFGPLLYLALITSKIKESDINSYLDIFIFICFLQFVFVLIKFFLHGIDEKFLIGTLSQTAGQLGFLFPAIAIPIIIYSQFRRGRIKTYSYVFFMLVFSVLNEKRSSLFLLPLIIFICLLINKTKKKFIADTFIFLLMVLGFIVASIFLIPSFSESPNVFEYTINYLTMNYGSQLQGSYSQAPYDSNIQVGRLLLASQIFDWIISQDLLTIIFGKGFGSFTTSVWLEQDSDLLFPVIKTRGAICGAELALLETGILGLGFFVWFFIRFFRQTLIVLREAKTLNEVRLCHTLLLLNCIFCYDFFFYSTTLIRVFPLPLFFFFNLATIYFLKIKFFKFN